MRILVACLALAAIAAEPVASPVSPAESLRQFVLSPTLDLRIDLVAAEPEVIDPVAVAFDEAGRMFVVEMRDYPSGPPDGQPPLSRLKLLEDKDGDGRFETAHVYADGLPFATGVLPWDGGAIVTLAGEVRFVKDTDGDFQADVNEVWFAGFAEENPQLRANHPTLGPDGKIYIANGLRGGKIKAVKAGWPDAVIDLRDGDFRFDPRTGEAEAVAGGGQFGLTFDAAGDRFICSNRNPCDHVVLEYADLARQPHLAIGKPVQVVVPAGNDSRVFPLVDAWTTSTRHAGQFTAACGVKIFTGDALPPECSGNVFTCEPTGSLVHRAVLHPAGGTFTSTPGEPDGSEFLASRDPWFRPVNLAVGPDGALYVADMYRAVIEHPQWMPEELRTRRDLRWGDDRGRIYRIAAKDKPPGRTPKPALETEPRPSGSGELAPGESDPQPLPDGRGSDADLLDRAASDDARVRFETALAIGRGPASVEPDRALAALATIAARDANDRWTRIAVLTSTRDPLALYDAVVQRDADGAVPFLVDLAELVGRRKEKTELGGLIDRLATTGPEGGWALPILLGLGQGSGGTLGPALAAANDRSRRRMLDVFGSEAAIAADAGVPEPQRIEAVGIVALADRSFALPSLLELVGQTDPAVRIAAIEALGRFRDDDRIAPVLLAGFDRQTPAVRSAALNALLADRGRAAAVLDAVEAGTVAAADLGPTRIDALTKHPDAAVRARAKTLFAPAADRLAVLADYADVLALPADVVRGRLVFEKNCAVCHRVAGLGHQVGPDIADSYARTPLSLLTDVLDPNRAIDGNFVAYTALLKDGTVQTGLLAGETSAAITLKQAEAKTVTIDRSEIEELRSAGASLMPVGVERTVSKQQMADLIAFVKNWRYADGAVPLGER